MDIKVDFPNQFFLFNLPDGAQAIYQATQDFKEKGPNIDITSEIYLKRIEKSDRYFTGNNFLKDKELAFGIKPNHLTQYLTWHHLLLNPKVRFVSLSGVAGSGKTLLAYLAGLNQTLVDSKDKVERENKKGNYTFRNLRLLKPAVPPQEHAVGFLPGDLKDKLGPQMKSFQEIHDEDLDLGVPYKIANTISQSNQYEKWGLYAPSNKVPLCLEDTIAFAKGSTWGKQWIIVDEAEDLNRRDGTGIATRVGLGSKIIFCGDPYQVHNPKCTSHKNGLVHLAHQYIKTQHPQFGIMHLGKTNRSPVANAAAKFPNYKD